MDQIFQQTKDYFEQLDQVKEKIQSCTRDLDEPLALLQGIFHKIHQNKSNYKEHITELCSSSNQYIQKCSESLMRLSESIPENSYYKYYNMWQYRLSNLCSLIALKHFLTKDLEDDLDHALITKDQVEQLLGIDKMKNFYLPLEDYL